MDETTENVQEPTPGTEPSAPKGLPPWAWSVIGVVVGAALIGGVWLVYESGRSAGKNDGFAVGTIETSATQGADAAEFADASATVDDTATAQATDGSTASGSSSGGSSSGSISGGSTGGSSSGSSSGSSGSDSSQDLPAPPTPITPTKPSLKQKVPVAVWTTKLTKTHSGSWTSDDLTYSTAQHVRLVISVVEGDGSGNMNVKFQNPQVNGWSHELFNTAHATTGASVTTPAQDVEPNHDYKVKVTADSDVKWTVKIQTRP